MNRTQRKLFTLFFVLLFALVAPTIVLFAQGYRFNLENNIFIHSGSITIKSWPRDISIFIDGKRQLNKNLSIINRAYTINGIKPGKYKLTCSKPGYSTWEKEINVHSGFSTEFWNVILFPEQENLETEIFQTSGEIQQFFLSPEKNEELILFTQNKKKNQIHRLNTKNQKTELIFETAKYAFINKEAGLNIEWNAENKKFILPVLENKQKKHIIVNTEINDSEENLIVLDDFFENSLIEKARWMFDEKEKLILLTEKKELFSFDYKNQIKVLIAENVSSFDFADYNIYYTQLPNNIVWEVKQNDLKNKEQITSEILSSENEDSSVKITAYDKNRIFINNDNQNSLLYIKDKAKNINLKLKPNQNITGIQFSNDGKKVLCWNDNEVWYYMLRDWEVQPKRYTGEKITITRSSEPIKNVQWMDNYENILLSTNNTVRVFEADPRNKTNISDLISTQETIQNKDLLYNKNTQTAFYLNQNKIFSSILIDTSGFLGF
jgi:hypothetical protein